LQVQAPPTIMSRLSVRSGAEPVAWLVLASMFWHKHSRLPRTPAFGFCHVHQLHSSRSSSPLAYTLHKKPTLQAPAPLLLFHAQASLQPNPENALPKRAASCGIAQPIQVITLQLKHGHVNSCVVACASHCHVSLRCQSSAGLLHAIAAVHCNMLTLPECRLYKWTALGDPCAASTSQDHSLHCVSTCLHAIRYKSRLLLTMCCSVAVPTAAHSTSERVSLCMRNVHVGRFIVQGFNRQGICRPAVFEHVCSSYNSWMLLTLSAAVPFATCTLVRGADHVRGSVCSKNKSLHCVSTCLQV
jgi:hypothetical protein